jgi:uncharacterized protein YqjF (DUF2071 family)
MTSVQLPIQANRPFLTCEWRNLAIANFRVPPELLEDLVPHGTCLDLYQGEAFISIVGFLFKDTRVMGLPVPWHRQFEELNLRFYVRRKWDGEDRRGVVFIKEIAPRWAVAAIANTLYHENYVVLPMRHKFQGLLHPHTDNEQHATYEWHHADRWHALHMQVSGPPMPLEKGSHEEFIAEHYWGYCRQRDGGTIEYSVEHPPWRVWLNAGVRFSCDVEKLYGARFAEALSRPACSAFVAEGSAVRVHKPARISP